MTTLEARPTGVGARSALLIVDASRGFTDPASPLGADYRDEIARIGTLLGRFRALECPVFFTTIAYGDPGQAAVWRRKLPGLDMLRAGSRWVEIDARLAPAAGETVLVKGAPSAFRDTGLEQRLRRAGVDTVFLCGFTTSGCVRASAVDAVSADFRAVVVSDACGDRDPPAHRANLHDLGAKYADLATTERALALPRAWAGRRAGGG